MPFLRVSVTVTTHSPVSSPWVSLSVPPPLTTYCSPCCLGPPLHVWKKASQCPAWWPRRKSNIKVTSNPIVKYLPRLKLCYWDGHYILIFPTLLMLGPLCSLVGVGGPPWALVSSSPKEAGSSRSSRTLEPLFLSNLFPFLWGCVCLSFMLHPLHSQAAPPPHRPASRCVFPPPNPLSTCAFPCTLLPPPTPVCPAHSIPRPSGSHLENLGRKSLTQDGHSQNGGTP